MTDVRLDDRSEKTIATLQLPARSKCREHLIKVQAWLNSNAPGIMVKAISGLRTYAEQDNLYAQGRTKPGRPVTNAPAGHSWHNFGVAWDLGLFRGSDYLEDSPLYMKIVPIGKAMGLDCGALWHSSTDPPHYGLILGIDLETARKRHDAGTSLFVGTPFAQQLPAAETVKPVRQVLVTQPSQEPKGWTVVTPEKTFHAEADETAGIRKFVEEHGGTVGVDSVTRTITVSVSIGGK